MTWIENDFNVLIYSAYRLGDFNIGHLYSVNLILEILKSIIFLINIKIITNKKMISKLIVYIVLLLKKYIKIQHYLVYHDKTKVLNFFSFFQKRRD